VHGLLDVLAEQAPPLDLGGLLSRADERRVDGAPAQICSLADLVALKRSARRPSDLEDLDRLETAHGALPDPPR
jgi:predicted nucleotidyltransferase